MQRTHSDNHTSVVSLGEAGSRGSRSPQTLPRRSAENISPQPLNDYNSSNELSPQPLLGSSGETIAGFALNFFTAPFSIRRPRDTVKS